jgi:hypothetical protein
MDIRELRIEDRVSHNGDIGEVVEIKTTHARLLFKDTQVSKYLGDIDYRFSNDNGVVLATL